MPDPILNTPESPPAGPVIPVGLATRLMQIVGAGFAVIAGVTAVLDGDHSQTTVVALILSGVSFFVLAGGRYAQAALAELAQFWGVGRREDGYSLVEALLVVFLALVILIVLSRLM